MSIRDIIEAAPRRTVYNDCSDCSMARLDDDECALCEDAYERQRRFIATFDPEHVALMEAERVAAREFITDRASGVGFAVRKYDAWVDACEATDRYRKERGL